MIHVEKKAVSVYGGCNGCSNRAIRTVHVISVALSNSGLVFRLCEHCKKELIKELRARK